MLADSLSVSSRVRADHVFVDATIFDDHGRVFWAVQGRLVCVRSSSFVNVVEPA